MTAVVAFDLDGTLVDTPRAIGDTFAATFASLGLEPRELSAIRATIGLPLDQAFGSLTGVPSDDGLVAEAVRRYQRLFRELVLPRASELVFPGVADGLAMLRDQGFRLAVATSKVYASADALLEAAAIREHFSAVVGADQVRHPKPDPETARLIMQQLGVSPELTVMVGDTTHDLLMARAAGMRSIAVTYGVHGISELMASDPTWIADAFEDVLERIRTYVVAGDLLNDRTYHIEFNGHLTNHAKHAVIALAGLGASPQRIRAYYDDYTRLTPYGYSLEAPKPSKNVISSENWMRFFGKRTDFSSYCEFFDRQQSERGTEEMLARYVLSLIPGWVGSFTHAAIHLGWALDAANRWMTVEGLAYLAFSYVSCHPERAVPARDRRSDGDLAVDSLQRIAAAWEDHHDELQDWVEQVIADESAERAMRIHPELARSGLQYRIAMLLEAGHPLIYEIPSWLENKDVAASWEQLWYAVTLLYLCEPGDFVLLHLITSLYGMEQIADRLPADQQEYVARCFWIGMLCIMFSRADFPTTAQLAALHSRYGEAVDADLSSVKTQDWDRIVDRATDETEEHNPKLVYVLQRLWRRTGGRTIYRAAAAQFTTTPELPKSFENPPTE